MVWAAAPAPYYGLRHLRDESGVHGQSTTGLYSQLRCRGSARRSTTHLDVDAAGQQQVQQRQAEGQHRHGQRDQQLVRDVI